MLARSGCSDMSASSFSRRSSSISSSSSSSKLSSISSCMRSWVVLASSVMGRSIGLAVDVVNQDTRAGRRHHQPLLMLERTPGILIAALPVLAHGGAGELVVLGVPLIGLLLVDDVEDADLRQRGELVLQPALVVRKLLLRNLGQSLREPRLPDLNAAKDIGVVPRARGIHDVLVAGEHILDVARQHAVGAEQVDLEHQR